MIRLLCDLLDQPEPVVSAGSTIWIRCRPEIEALRKAGALEPAEPARTTLCPACADHHFVRVERSETGVFRAYCPSEGYLEIDVDDLTVLQASIPWLIDALRFGINVQNRPAAEELVAGHLWLVGEQRIGPYRIRFHLGRRLTEQDTLDRASAVLASHGLAVPGLLFTTVDPARIAARLPRRHAALQLSDACRITGGGVRIDEDSLLTAVRAGDRTIVGAGGVGYVFSVGFRSATVGDRRYTFTKKQAAVIEALYQAYDSGLDRVHQDELASQADSNQRIVQIFRGNMDAYEHLIGSDSQGYYRLKI